MANHIVEREREPDGLPHQQCVLLAHILQVLRHFLRQLCADLQKPASRSTMCMHPGKRDAVIGKSEADVIMSLPGVCVEI